MTTAASFEGIRYVRSDLFNTTALTPLRETHHKGGILGTVLGVVAAIVVPFVAPMIAGTLFGAGTALGTAFPMLAGAATGTASALGTSLAGAAIGAGTSALTGGNPLTGALLGGVASGANALFGGAPLVGGAETGATLTSAAPATGIGAADISSVAGQNLAPTASIDAALTAAAPAVPAATPSTLGSTLSTVTGTLGDVASSKLGQAAIGAGIQALPGMLAADQANAAAAAQADLAQAQANVFKNQMSIAEELKQSALAVDPQYLGQRAQAGVFKNLAAQQREMAGQEAIRGGESQAAFDAAELRRGQIYGTEAAITAGDNARLAGLSTQSQLLRGASAAYPTPPSGYASYLERAAGNSAEGWGNIAGAFAYPFMTPYMQSFYKSQKNPNAVG